jgi:hypothetical protein
MSWHVAGQVTGPAGIDKLEPIEDAQPHGRTEKAQLAEARKIAKAALKYAGKRGPYLVAMAGHAATGQEGEPEAHLTVSVAHDNSSVEPGA